MNPIRGWLADARQNPDTRHVDTCDGVRALAILIVAWYHIWQQSWLLSGNADDWRKKRSALTLWCGQAISGWIS